MRKPRVLMLGWEFPPNISGGLGVACEGLSRALSQVVDLTLILPQANPAFQIKGVKIIGVNQSEITSAKILSPEKALPAELSPYLDADPQFASNGSLYDSEMAQRVAGFARAAAAISEEKKFNLIHAHDWMTFLAGLEIKKHSGKPLIFHVHSLTYDRAGPDSRNWIYEIEKTAMKKADLIIAVSDYTREICIQNYQAAPEKVVTVHNGVTPVKAFRRPKPFPEKLILFLGRMTAQKGPAAFLEIARRVLEKNPHVRFALAGQGDQLPALMTRARQLGIAQKCHFTGFLQRHEIHRLLSMTDLYCMPSLSEPFGLSALEAAQFGIPAVLSKQSGAAEVLTQARTADSWDLEKMAARIIELITNENAWQKASQSAFNDQKKATWQNAAAKIADIYKGPPTNPRPHLL